MISGSGRWLAALALTVLPAPAAAPPASLAAALARAAARLPAGGLVAAEVGGGAVRYFSAGSPAPRPGIPPERIIFEIGSITKVFTGLLLAQAVVEHRLSLDDPIGELLPASVRLDPVVSTITLEELATHTSGLPRFPDNGSPERYTVADLYAFLSAFRLPGPPPRPPSYSNVGPALLGIILERTYGLPYDELVERKIARPLGLVDTAIALSPEQWSRFSPPHAGPALLPPGNLPVFAAAAGLHSTAADLARFAEALMSPGRDPLRAAWEIARVPRHPFPAYEGFTGLGVFIMRRGAGTIYWHGGATFGSRSHLQWSPSTGRALVVLQDSDSVDSMNLAVTLYRLKPAATR